MNGPKAYDMRERYTSTSTLLGTAQTNMAEQKNGERIRLKLESPNPDGRTAGFVTITSWIFDLKIPASTDSTPVHRPTHGKNPTFKIDYTVSPIHIKSNFSDKLNFGDSLIRLELTV